MCLVGKNPGATGVNTLVQGPGGFGKTVLAIEACHRAETVNAFPDGILWTALGKEPNLAATLRELHVLATGTVPTVADVGTIGQAIAKALKGRRCEDTTSWANFTSARYGSRIR
jgi:ATP/maltotriose-dependent transcriptional regulator MalT